MTKDGLLIRAARRSDLQSLLELYRQLHPTDPAISQADADRVWEKFSSYPDSQIFIGVKDGMIVTTCTLVVIPNLTRGGLPYALIENVITDARQRKYGYGQAVLEKAISTAWMMNCYKVMLLTGSKNPATLTFYEKAGFEQSKTGFQIRRAVGTTGVIDEEGVAFR